MTIMAFKYQKDEDKLVDKVFVPITVPSEKYFGIDVTELDIDDQVSFEEEMNLIFLDQKDKIADLMNRFDLKHKYRYFFANKMQDVVVE